MKSFLAAATLAAFIAFLGVAGSASAALTITVPTNFPLLANTANQPVPLSVTGGDLVDNVVIDAVLGNGSGGHPGNNSNNNPQDLQHLLQQAVQQFGGM